MIYGDMIVESTEQITLVETYNFETILESINILRESDIINEGEFLTKIKDILITKLKRIWQAILDLIAKIKHFINEKFKNIIVKYYNNLKEKIKDIRSKENSNSNIHNSLVQQIDPILYGACINDKETYINGLTKEDEEKYSPKNAFYTIYEMYKKIPKKVKIEEVSTMFDGFFKNKRYDVSGNNIGDNSLYEKFYDELKKVFGTNNKDSTYSITIKKYDAGIGNNTENYQVSRDEEINILTTRLDSTIAAMNEMEEPYNTILNDKIKYNSYLKSIIIYNWQIASGEEKNKLYSAFAKGIFEDFAIYKAMITLYSKVYFGFGKECLNNLNVLSNTIKTINSAQNTI